MATQAVGNRFPAEVQEKDKLGEAKRDLQDKAGELRDSAKQKAGELTLETKRAETTRRRSLRVCGQVEH